MAHASGTSNGSGFTQRVGAYVASATAKTETSGNAADKISKGFEVVITTVIFGGIGALLDAWLGTRPWIMFALGGFALGYQVWKIVVGYEAEMREHEDQMLPPALRQKREAARRQDGAA
jgi:F0F1-type ATP synthase assembly protein I